MLPYLKVESLRIRDGSEPLIDNRSSQSGDDWPPKYALMRKRNGVANRVPAPGAGNPVILSGMAEGKEDPN